MKDYQQNGKKFDYQQRARDTLLRIENIIISKKQDQCFDLIAEFIFLEKQNHDHQQRHQRNSSHSSSSSASTSSASLLSLKNQSQLAIGQEFQLVIVLCEFFSRNSPDIIKNAIFLSLFGGSNTPYTRSRVLVKLISTAISESIAPILRAAGTWMQQLGPTSAPCLELAYHIIQDFIIFSKKCTNQLKCISSIAPRFAINLMTAMADLYLNDNKNTDFYVQTIVPPDTLLDVITEWVLENPSMSNQPPLALPSGAISMPLIPPTVGLIRWCALAPLFQDTSDTAASYNKLHLAILQSLLQNQPTPTPINALHLGAIVIGLKKKFDELSEMNVNIELDQRVQCSLERYAQSIQIALSAHAISGNIPQLISRIETLPRNPLLQIVIKANKN